MKKGAMIILVLIVIAVVIGIVVWNKRNKLIDKMVVL
jgi:nitrate/TMAO reductase-like tetraheme cytochrome c subunit